MSTTTVTPATVGSTTPDHPLTPLSADEIRTAKAVLVDEGLIGENVRFVFVALDEPHKSMVLAFTPGDPIERRARILLLDRSTGIGTDLVVSVTENRVISSTAVDGHVPILVRRRHGAGDECRRSAGSLVGPSPEVVR